MAHVKITREGDRAVVKSVGYLGDAFVAFTQACRHHGFRWNGKRGEDASNVGTIKRVAEFIVMLSRAAIGLPIAADQGTTIYLGESSAGKDASDVVNVDEHLEAIKGFRDAGLAPFPFQREGIKWLLDRDCAFNADEMGLGKTVQYLLALPSMASAIIECPSFLKFNQAVECVRWRHDLTPIVYVANSTIKATEAWRKRGILLRLTSEFEFPLQGEVAIINYESTPAVATQYHLCSNDGRVGKAKTIRHPSSVEFYAWMSDTLTLEPKGRDRVNVAQDMFATPRKGTVLISDEIHRCKSPKAKRTFRHNALKDLVLKGGGKVWVFTGTPLFNKPLDLMNVLRACNLFNDAFPSFGDFVTRMGGHKGRYGMKWTGAVDPSVAGSLKRVMLRREKADVLPDLPEMRYSDIHVEASQEIIAAVEAISDKLWAKGDVDGARSASALAQRCLDAPDFEDRSRLFSAISAAALDTVIERVEDLEDAGEPVVVFFKHRAPVLELGRRKGWGMIIGGMSDADRQMVVEDFQAGRLKGLVGTIDACKEGLTLTRSAYVIFGSFSENPSDNEQAAARVHRHGQTRSPLIERVVPAHPMVEALIELVTWKARMTSVAITGAKVTTTVAQEQGSEEALLAATALMVLEAHGEAVDRENAVAEHVASEPELRSSPAPSFPSGTYALDAQAGHTAFYKVNVVFTRGKWYGWTFVTLVTGGSPDKRIGARRPDGTQTGSVHKVLNTIAADPKAASARYGREIGRCGLCSKLLTNEESRRIGIGPVCLEKAGW